MTRLFSFLLVTLIFCGCSVNYSFTGASISPEVKTISIAFFDNRAPLAKPTLSNTFTEELKDIFQAQTNLSLISKAGDLNLEGHISDYRTAPVAIQGDETAAKNRLTISVMVKFTNIIEPENDFESSFTRYAEYESSQSLSSIEDDLIDEINEQLTQDIFNKAVSNW